MVVARPLFVTFLCGITLLAATDVPARMRASSVHAGFGGVVLTGDEQGGGREFNLGVASALAEDTSVTVDLYYRRMAWVDGITTRPPSTLVGDDYIFHTLALGLDLAVPNRLGSAPFAAIGLGVTRRTPRSLHSSNVVSQYLPREFTNRYPAALMITPSLGIGLHFRFRETRHGFHAGFTYTQWPSTLGARVQLDL